MKLVTALTLASVLVAVMAVADDTVPPVHSTHVTGPIWMIEGAGGNITASIGKDGILLVDDELTEVAPEVKAEVERLAGKDAGEPRLILNTHWHGDHTGGNALFAKDGIIVAQTNVRKRLTETQKIRGEEVPPSPPEAWPVVTFDDELTVHWNGEELRLLHLRPGHTDGDVVVYFSGSNVVATGDLFFSGLFPFIDLESGGNVEGYLEDVETLLDRYPKDATFIPGHGPLSKRAELVTFHGMLLETMEIVRGRIAKGMSLEEIQKAGLPEKWSSFSFPFVTTETWLATLYQGLAPKTGK